MASRNKTAFKKALVFVVFCCVLFAVVVPTFVKHIRKSGGGEIHDHSWRLTSGARIYYMRNRWDSNGNVIMHHSFPNARRIPNTYNCKGMNTPQEKWAEYGWDALHFSVTPVHYYIYEFKSSGVDMNAKFTATATGDLDCDGEFVKYEWRGGISKHDGSVEITGPIITNQKKWLWFKNR